MVHICIYCMLTFLFTLLQNYFSYFINQRHFSHLTSVLFWHIITPCIKNFREANKNVTGNIVFKQDFFFLWLIKAQLITLGLFYIIIVLKQGILPHWYVVKFDLAEKMGNGRFYIFHFSISLSNMCPLWESSVRAKLRKHWF